MSTLARLSAIPSAASVFPTRPGGPQSISHPATKAASARRTEGWPRGRQSGGKTGRSAASGTPTTGVLHRTSARPEPVSRTWKSDGASAWAATVRGTSAAEPRTAARTTLARPRPRTLVPEKWLRPRERDVDPSRITGRIEPGLRLPGVRDLDRVPRPPRAELRSRALLAALVAKLLQELGPDRFERRHARRNPLANPDEVPAVARADRARPLAALHLGELLRKARAEDPLQVPLRGVPDLGAERKRIPEGRGPVGAGVLAEQALEQVARVAVDP